MTHRFWIALAASTLCALLALPLKAEPWKAAGTIQAELAAAALAQTHEHVVYDGSYQVIDYPGGDVARDHGVCTDVLIRAYRELGIDLQVLVHEDMSRHFALYPHDWGLTHPDTNIDHRRVPNLQAFFTRKGESLPVSPDGRDYRPGDLVTWRLGASLPHIGVVSDRLSADGERPLIIHNIGLGPKLEDMLFDYPITGHYRFPASPAA
jgi:uncharacterized protein YijF (DUF1287 family)